MLRMHICARHIIDGEWIVELRAGDGSLIDLGPESVFGGPCHAFGCYSLEAALEEYLDGIDALGLEAVPWAAINVDDLETDEQLEERLEALADEFSGSPLRGAISRLPVVVG
jgi:hypothetical protein